MKHLFCMMVAAVTAVMAWAQQAVLYIGSDWSDATKGLQAAWENSDFAQSAGVALATVDLPEKVTDEVRAKWEEQKAIRWELRAVPGFAYFDAKGRCVFLKQGLPAVSGKSAERLLKTLIATGQQRAKTIEALLAKRTADGAGEALALVVPELGVRWSKEARGMKEAWDILAEVDKDDKSGWQFALTFDPIDASWKVQDLRKQGDDKVNAYLAELNAKPKAHLSTNQKQGMKLLQVVPLKRTAEENAILKEVAAMDPTTHYGAAAQGLLAYRGEGDISVPYGWFAKDAKAGDQTWEVSAGVARVLREPGTYLLTIRRTAGKGEAKVTGLTFNGRMYGAPKPLAVGEAVEIPFEMRKGDAPEFTLAMHFANPSEEAGRLELKGALPARVGRGTRPRSIPVTKGTEQLRAYFNLVVPRETVDEIGRLPKGEDFLKAFYSDKEWMENFFASGKPAKDWATSLKALDVLYYYGQPKTAFAKRLATAGALNVGGDPTEMVLLYQAMMTNYTKKLLSRETAQYRVDQLRYVMLPEQVAADDARWLAKEHHVPARMYPGVCWHAPYRLNNFFGDSIHGSDYYRAWDHYYTRHERSRHVGAVCGGLSYYGSAATKAHGIPSTPAGQPAHCAYTVWLPSEQQWTIGYNVNPYTWTHFDAWEGRYHYSSLDIQGEAFAQPKWRESMRALWDAEVLRARRPPSPRRLPMTCEAYAWTQRALPKSVEGLEKLGSWEKETDFNLDCARRNHVYYVWTGFYDVPLEMTTKVKVRSDDGAALYIDGKLVAGKDGAHGMEGSEATLTLSKGKHAFELRYFNLDGGRGLEVSVGPQILFDPVIDKAYRKAVEVAPLNLPAWKAYGQYLAACENTSLANWNAYGDALAKALENHLEPAWIVLRDVVIPQVKRLGGKDALKAALVRWNGMLHQGPQTTAEFCNYHELLEMQAKALDNDANAVFEVFTAALPAQFGTRDAFGRLMRWGSARFMKDDAMAKRYIAALNDLLKAKGNEGNALGRYVREAIVEASNAGNLEAFHALCDLQDTLNPQERKEMDFKKLTDKPLLSADGMLVISSTSQWDHPEAYRHVIDGRSNSSNFHTGNMEQPWAEVRLPGMAEVSAVYLDNIKGQNGWRLVPFVIEVSENGKNWKKVASYDKVEGTYQVTFDPVKAQHVRVRTTAGDKRLLHLHKFCVFGKKLY